jgi:DNA-binding NtrC family response regulator
VVVLTGHGTIDTAIEAIRLGAYDYLEKPCPIEKLLLTIEKTHEHVSLVRRRQVLEDRYSIPDPFPGVVGASEAFRKLLDAISRVARTEATTLILGETGVGKEIVASLLHTQSPRSERPFVVVDCAALHEELLQSELFGHEKGAFTGAGRLKHGLFEVADGGTIFLDEIGDISLEVQSNLLRVLESGRFRRLGGILEIRVDVRVLAATNRDLEAAVSGGQFRADLFYRLATLRLDVPPLRGRSVDIRLLVEHYCRHFNKRFGVSRCFSEEALTHLERYEWPGNVRELIHVVEQSIVLADRDIIRLADLPGAISGDSAPPPPDSGEGQPLSLREAERQHVLAVLRQVGGNRARAARLLEVSERNLYRLLKRYAEDGDGGLSDAPQP